MRTTVTLLFFFLSLSLIHATHNRAGEITYKQISDLTVEATITTYTQTSSLPADRDSLQICWGDGNCEMLVRTNSGGDELENDYKVNYYTGVHRYSSLGDYSISMTDPNRNSDVLNVNAPNSDRIQFHLQSTVHLMNTAIEGSNLSPTLLVPPIDVGYVRQPFMHTPHAIDLDGDSIAYEMVSPLMDIDEAVPSFVQIDQIGAGIENTYTFNEVTGLLVWNSPQIVGQYNVAIKIKAYRADKLVDVLIRDMQILIKPEENTPPRVTFTNNEQEQLSIKAGKTIDLDFTIYDSEDDFNINGVPTLTITGEAIQNNTQLTQEQQVSVLNGRFSWTPTIEDIRTRPYQIVFKATDTDGLATFKIFQIQVKSTATSIKNEFKDLGFKLFPNPSAIATTLQLPDNQVNKPATISIYDSLGRLVFQKNIDHTTVAIPLNTSTFTNGNYVVRFQSDDRTVSSILLVH